MNVSGVGASQGAGLAQSPMHSSSSQSSMAVMMIGGKDDDDDKMIFIASSQSQCYSSQGAIAAPASTGGAVDTTA